MKIADGIEMLKIETNIMGEPNYIYPVLIKCEKNILLVDTGYPGPTSFQKLLSSLSELGVTPYDITKIILTHQDLDHIGGLLLFLKENPSIEFVCHEAEKPYVEGEKKLVKISKSAEHSMENLPEHVKNALMQVFQNPPKAPVTATLQDGQVLKLYGGITVIHTPGHTPGHICLYVQKARLLIAGDAIISQNGKLYGPVPQYAQEIEKARQSLSSLKAFDIEKVICYHGGFVENAKEQLKALGAQ